MKRAFEVKQKTFFHASQVLSFRYKKQTSKNVANTIFKNEPIFSLVISKLMPAFSL